MSALLITSLTLQAQELNSRETSELAVFQTKDYSIMEHTTLEALLNMLPGVRVDRSGNISKDNDEIVKIMVDGMEIFGEGRRSIALRNIQAYAIEEIWFYKKDGSASNLLDHSMGDDVKVLDIRLKKEYNTGIPLDLKSGIGSGESVHYKGNLLGLYNNSDTRVFFYGSADNLNEGELTNNYSFNTQSTFPDGLLSNYSGGASLLKYLDKNKKSYVLTAAGVTQDDIECEKETNTRIFLPGREILVPGSNTSISESLKANSNTKLHLEDAHSFHDVYLDFTYSSYSMEGKDKLSVTNRLNKISSLQRNRDIYQQNYLLRTGYDGGLRLNRGMLRWGAGLQYDNSTNRDNTFYSITLPLQGHGTIYRNNYWNSPMQNAKGEVAFGYEIDNLGIMNFLQAHYLYDCTWESVDSTLQTLNGTIMERDSLNSYSSKVLTHRHNLMLKSKVNLESLMDIPLSATLSLPIRFVSREMDYLRLRSNNYRRSNVLCEPSLEIELSGRHTFKLNADLITSLPPMLYCTPFRNTSNPLHILTGNPELDNIQNLLLKFTHERTTSNSAFYKTTLEYRHTDNDIGTNVHFDEKSGVFTSMPINVDGSWGLTGDFWVNTPLDGRKGRLTLENRFYTSYAHDIDMTSQEGMTNSTRYNTHTVLLANDFMLTYRPSSKWDLRAICSGMWVHSHSNIPDFDTINTGELYYGFRAQGELPWQIHLGSTLMVNYTCGYDNYDMNGNSLIWNAELSRSFFQDQLIVTAKGFDILGQLTNEYHTFTPLSITEVTTNVVPRSFILTLAWKMHRLWK